jgi:hypothetical protein
VAAVKIPGLQKPPWYTRKILLACFTGACAILVAVAAALSRNGEAATIGWWATAGLAAKTVLELFAARHEDSKRNNHESPIDLTGCLHVLHAATTASKAMSPGDSSLRITIHRLEGDDVCQIVDYVGGKGDGMGRTFSSRCGVVGKAITSGKPWAMHRDSDNFSDYINTMREQYGMTEEEAQGLARDRMSFLAVPLNGGVVYLDCSVANFFDTITVGLVTQACSGMSEFINFRYAKRERI